MRSIFSNMRDLYPSIFSYLAKLTTISLYNFIVIFRGKSYEFY
nr:MAG TPA: hypothetical protein [Caudoviricetes sp.]